MKILTAPCLMFSLVLFSSSLFASTPDGFTPAQENACSGLSGELFGICNSYCEAMDCDNPFHKASDKACQSILRKWNSLVSDRPIPCESQPKISLVKEVNKDVDGFIRTDTEVVYTFTFMNVGNVPLKDITLVDSTIPNGALSDCQNNVLNGLILGVNQTVQCTTDGSPVILAPSDSQDSKVTNRATANALSFYGQPVSANAEVTYIGESFVLRPQCPCSAARLRLAYQTWNEIVVNGVPATPIEQHCSSNTLIGTNEFVFSQPYNAPDQTALRVKVGPLDNPPEGEIGVNYCSISVIENGVVKYSTALKAQPSYEFGNVVGPCSQLMTFVCESMQ